MKSFLVTGGAGFIGSNFVGAFLSQRPTDNVVVLDALTYSGNRSNLREFESLDRFQFVHGNICDTALVDELFQRHQFQGVFHFAAESHVDKSIQDPGVFIQSNIVGTHVLLNAAKNLWLAADHSKNPTFQQARFLHVSTDEVFGSLGPTGHFTEHSPYAPNSPYSASKAASDHFVRAFHKTYGLDAVTTNCSNNYGPKQFPEKLIPLMILRALNRRSLPIYGSGQNVRDWIHVSDHVDGVLAAFDKGQAGETYCMGGSSELTNLQVVKVICSLLDRLKPRGDGESYEKLIEYVQDRPGHDFRYAIDDRKAIQQLGFTKKFANFEKGLEQTVTWYLENMDFLNKSNP